VLTLTEFYKKKRFLFNVFFLFLMSTFFTSMVSRIQMPILDAAESCLNNAWIAVATLKFAYEAI
jgi:hypothetical protein